MKIRRILFFIIMLIVLGMMSSTILVAQEVPEILLEHKLGLIFNIGAPLLSIEEHNDDVQSGLGVKLWINDKSALRALLDLNFLNDSGAGTTVFTLGIGSAFEYHLLREKISPYIGAVGGVRFETGAGNNLTLYAGGLLGAEVALV